MGGWIKFLGFAVPISIALDNGASPGRDGLPRAGICSLCKRFKAVTYLMGVDERVCEDDIEDTVNSKAVQRVRSHPRSIEHPVEVVNLYGPSIDPMWDKAFA